MAAALTIWGLMPRYEYKVVPAPAKGLKAKGIRSPEARFAHALASAMNELGAAGWSYLRTDTLPAEERVGLTRTKTTYHNMLVFRRELQEDVQLQEVAQSSPPPPTALELAFQAPQPVPRIAYEDTPEDPEDAEDAPSASILTILQARRAETEDVNEIAAE